MQDALNAVRAAGSVIQKFMEAAVAHDPFAWHQFDEQGRCVRCSNTRARILNWPVEMQIEASYACLEGPLPSVPDDDDVEDETASLSLSFSESSSPDIQWSRSASPTSALSPSVTFSASASPEIPSLDIEIVEHDRDARRRTRMRILPAPSGGPVNHRRSADDWAFAIDGESTPLVEHSIDARMKTCRWCGVAVEALHLMSTEELFFNAGRCAMMRAQKEAGHDSAQSGASSDADPSGKTRKIIFEDEDK